MNSIVEFQHSLTVVGASGSESVGDGG